MTLNDPHDFSDSIDLSDDLVQTTQVIQKSCNDLHHELDDAASHGLLHPAEYVEIQERIEALHACATSFLRTHKGKT